MNQVLKKAQVNYTLKFNLILALTPLIQQWSYMFLIVKWNKHVQVVFIYNFKSKSQHNLN